MKLVIERDCEVTFFLMLLHFVIPLTLFFNVFHSIFFVEAKRYIKPIWGKIKTDS